MSSSRLLVDGPKCPTCGHNELLYTVRPTYGWGFSDGCRETVRRDCPRCEWGEEGPWQ